jgi:hypothetical protein
MKYLFIVFSREEFIYPSAVSWRNLANGPQKGLTPKTVEIVPLSPDDQPEEPFRQ